MRQRSERDMVKRENVVLNGNFSEWTLSQTEKAELKKRILYAIGKVKREL